MSNKIIFETEKQGCFIALINNSYQIEIKDYLHKITINS
jgi:hypothetical protein